MRPGLSSSEHALAPTAPPALNEAHVARVVGAVSLQGRAHEYPSSDPRCGRRTAQRDRSGLGIPGPGRSANLANERRQALGMSVPHTPEPCRQAGIASDRVVVSHHHHRVPCKARYSLKSIGLASASLPHLNAASVSAFLRGLQQ